MTYCGKWLFPEAARLTDSVQDTIIFMYEQEICLVDLPEMLFHVIPAVAIADAIGYTEVHHASGKFRALLSVEDDPVRRASAINAFATHMHSHPFWAGDPAFFGERALRDTDFFSDDDYLRLPIAVEAFLPSNVRHHMRVVMVQDRYSLTLSLHRMLGRPPFSDEERDRLAALRPHMLRIYRQALDRAISRLTPVDRLRISHPGLTPRQIEVAHWLIQGKANEDIATILDIGIDAVKAHIKVIFRKIGVGSRHELTRHAFVALPSEDLPPLWTLESLKN